MKKQLKFSDVIYAAMLLVCTAVIMGIMCAAFLAPAFYMLRWIFS